MRRRWVSKFLGDSFEGFFWFLNVIAGSEKGGNQEEWGKKGKKMRLRMKERSKRIVEFKLYLLSVVFGSWVFWGGWGFCNYYSQYYY